MRAYLELGLELTLAQDLDARILADEAFRGDRVRCDAAFRRVVREPPDVHRDEVLAKTVLETAKLGHAHVERRLSALEPARKARSGACELTLRSATRGLALSLGGAPPETPARLARSALRTNVVLAHQRDSFISTRCATRRSLPRNAGVSACDTI